MELVRLGKADALINGSLLTDELMAAVVTLTGGIRTARRISQCCIMDVPGHADRLIIADAALDGSRPSWVRLVTSRRQLRRSLTGTRRPVGSQPGRAAGTSTALRTLQGNRSPAMPHPASGRGAGHRGSTEAWPDSRESPCRAREPPSLARAPAPRIHRTTAATAAWGASLLAVPQTNGTRPARRERAVAGRQRMVSGFGRNDC